MSILNSCNLRAPFFQFDRKIFYILHQKYLVGGKNNFFANGRNSWSISSAEQELTDFIFLKVRIISES